MVNLEYRIGGIEIDIEQFRLEGDDPNDACHLFVVEALDNVLSVYLAAEEWQRIAGHGDVANKFSAKGKLVGGGRCYLNNEDRLVFGSRSKNYGRIPTNVAQRFAELLAPEIDKLGLKTSGIIASPDFNGFLNDYWKEIGFSSE